jgi:hypothetical protein
MSLNLVPSPFFRPLEVIPMSGIYCVYHAGHRTSHEVTLLRGELFPECKVCGRSVHFELLREAPGLDSEHDLHIRLYQVPHPADEAA